MKVGFFDVQDWEKDLIEIMLNKHFNDYYITKDKLDEENAEKLNDFDIISIFMQSNLNKKILSKLKNLKFIATRSTGFDHINKRYCKQNKIKISNVPYYGENTVAEHTFALILTISKKIYQAIEKTKKGEFSLEGLMGFDLKGKTIGIIGLGSIGKHVARISSGFEMNIIYYDIKKDKKLEKKYHLKLKKLDNLLKESDIITLHMPLNKKTKYMINKKNINNIKKGAIIINTARGGLIETDALVYGINKKIIKGIGLDVLEEEETIKEDEKLYFKNLSNQELKMLLEEHLLIKNEDVLITPHCAFFSKEAVERILDTTIANILAYKKNKPINLIK